MARCGVTTAAILVIFAAASAVAQSSETAWVGWAREHAQPIRIPSVPADDFSDLQFLKRTLAGRRIVQLGESGHGVAQFNQVKVRLIKFLHEQMDFDVLAFEGGLVDCYAVNDPATPAVIAMRTCLYPVWHTQEVLPLFNYVKDRQRTGRPLTLAGFDVPNSYPGGLTRNLFFGTVIRAIDPVYASLVQVQDEEFRQSVQSIGGDAYAAHNEARLTEFYTGLELYFRANRAQLDAAIGPPRAQIAERAAWSMLRNLERLRANYYRPRDTTSDSSGGAVRDRGMADNLTYLAREIYGDRKVIVWAHNFHVRHDNSATAMRQRVMGEFVRERFRDELYTIGLYMNEGTAAYNDRSIYAIRPAPAGSMEWVLASTGLRTLFIDLLHQTHTTGNEWMFQPTTQREWGTRSFSMVPRNQYDGVVFVESVSAPAYIPL